MKIYTKTGDDGTTGLIGGSRVAKHHPQIEAFGTIDELNSWLGLIISQGIDKHSEKKLLSVQQQLFRICSELAAPQKNKSTLPVKKLDKEIQCIEKEIDTIEQHLPALKQFILQGGHPLTAHCHIARTVCRRAERRISLLAEKNKKYSGMLPYINRLSDYLFVLSRKFSFDHHTKENSMNF